MGFTKYVILPFSKMKRLNYQQIVFSVGKNRVSLINFFLRSIGFLTSYYSHFLVLYASIILGFGKTLPFPLYFVSQIEFNRLFVFCFFNN